MADRRRHILFGDGREFQGTALEIITAMRGEMFGQEISINDFIDWLRGQFKGSVGLLNVGPGQEDQRARVLVQKMIETRIVDDLDNPRITTIMLMSEEPEATPHRGNKKARRRQRTLH